MACNDCHTLESIPECSDNLELGVVDHAETTIFIYVKNLFSGYIHKHQADSDSDGAIVLDLSQPDPSFYNKDSQYEIWATLTTDNERLEITVAYGIVATCINASFFQINSTSE